MKKEKVLKIGKVDVRIIEDENSIRVIKTVEGRFKSEEYATKRDGGFYEELKEIIRKMENGEIIF